MTISAIALGERATHGLIDAAAGAVVALCALTVAHAALPARQAPPTPRPIQTVEAKAQPAQTTLIAFQDPLPGEEIASPFGLRQMPWEASGRLHAGVDIPAPSGERIRLAADGVIVRAGESSTYGRFAEVRHAEGLTTLYAHMGRIAPGVRSGVALKAGSTVGQVGSSGTSTGPHLHFEIRDAQDRPMNPDAFIGRAFATADELPLALARRVPNGVRIAHVSRIPTGKMQVTQARFIRRDGQAANLAAAREAVAAEAEPVGTAPVLGFRPKGPEAGKPAIPDFVVSTGADGRPKATLQL
ncbi:M23 family metallopeptidase [Phenylobacterium immobile]|uniref:M23 family metallopeptidase n=1 Tax=Phenylobacterium immobile TaxID=21 RepID=UPI000AD0E001|nr:M23 family metallopeptidase [Phenylobacterium immobile]